MSTFILPDSEPEVQVKLVPELSKDQLLGFPAFKTWISTLQHSLSLQSNQSHVFHKSPYILRKIDVQAVDFFGGKKIGFIKFRAEVMNKEGEMLPGSIFLRGGSVAMMMILQPDDVSEESENEKHVVLAVQARVAAASLSFSEIPAGILEGGEFGGTAAREIEEETGLKVPESELINMTELAISPQIENGEKLQSAVYPSCGGCDEYIPIFLWQKRLPRKEISEMQGRLTGLREEGEKITLNLVKLEDIWKVAGRDGKALAAYALYRGLKGEGKI